MLFLSTAVLSLFNIIRGFVIAVLLYVVLDITVCCVRYHKASKQSMELHTLARYISELCLLDYSIAIELPSQVAMACLYVALRMNSLPWTEEIQLVTGAKVKDIISLAERVNSILLKAYHSNNNFNVKSKYAHEVFFQVALKRPMVTMTTTKEC